MHRILIPIDSQSDDAWTYALAYAEKISEVAGKTLDIVLLTHTKQQLNQGGLPHKLGAGVARSLSAGKSAQLSSGATVTVP